MYPHGGRLSGRALLDRPNIARRYIDCRAHIVRANGTQTRVQPRCQRCRPARQIIPPRSVAVATGAPVCTNRIQSYFGVAIRGRRPGERARAHPLLLVPPTAGNSCFDETPRWGPRRLHRTKGLRLPRHHVSSRNGGLHDTIWGQRSEAPQKPRAS